MRKLFFVACAAALLATASASAQKYTLTIAGASPKGVWSILGLALDKVMAATYPGSSVTYQTSGGGIANISLIDRKKVALALASTGEMNLARNAVKPFRKKIDSVRIIARAHAWLYFHPMLTKAAAAKYGITDFSDIAKKKPPIRISINRRGLLVSVIAEEMLNDIGVTLKDIESWGGKVVFAASGDTTSLMADRKLDGHMMVWPINHRALRQMEAAVPMQLLTVNDRSVTERVAKKLGMAIDTMPAGTYKSQPASLYVPSMDGNIIGHKNMDAKLAYAIAKAVHTNLKAFSSAHRFLGKLTPKFLVSSTG
ncbi:MAG: TAXI family TRAP transporter solute-binding subunit, partial [Proteobacteria bacterium]|nr:TAXI family TRAP transporter solute-binding subunit [Pseudomonadota bacterium]